MKTISNSRKIAVLVGLAVTFAASSVSPAFAIEGSSRPATTDKESAAKTAKETLSETKKAELCSRFANLGDSSRSTLQTKSTELKSDFAKRLADITSRQAAIDQKVVSTRANAAVEFDAKIEKLRTAAGTDQAKLTAIDAYVTSMKEAAKTRNAAVDAARTTYRTALSADITAHQQAISAAVAAYQAAVASAVATAKANCGDGTAAATLKSAVKTAREALQSARKSDKVGSDVKALAATRNDAIKAANETFRASAKTNAETLAAALKSTE